MIDQPKLDGGCCGEYLVEAIRIAHARQLNHNPIDALALHQRLGHAEFVHAVTQGGDVLLDGEVLSCLDLRFRHAHTQRLTVAAVEDEHVGIDVLDQLAHRGHFFGATQADTNIGAVEGAPVT